MAGRLAILACSGALPVEIAKANPGALKIGFAGVPNELPGDVHEFRFEKLGALWAFLRENSVERVVFAGGLARPPLDPSAFDSGMAAVAPRLAAAMSGGDDALLRLVIAVFEEQGFKVVGAHEICPGLTVGHAFEIGGSPSDADMSDAARARSILAALSPLDVGQACVVAGGQCLGIETMQGTDALLRFVASTPPLQRPKAPGVLVKAAKTGQDLRIDMPGIGPETVIATARAGLAGIIVEPQRVMILNREEVTDALGDTGLFLAARRT